MAKPRLPIWLCASLLLASTASGVTVSPTAKPWLRVDSGIHRLQLNRPNTWIAYTTSVDNRLHVLQLKSRSYYLVSEAKVGPAFFWSPDGARLFYRELLLGPHGGVVSVLKAYDTVLHKSILVKELASSSGYLTFDPRDLRMQLLYDKGIFSQRLFFPDERLARWQTSRHSAKGKWLATQKTILWISDGGLKMRPMVDDHSGIAAFNISPDGRGIAWGTERGQVFASVDGAPPQLVGYGRDPAWHPTERLLVYAAARVIGDKVLGYDLKVTDLKQTSRALTTSQTANERWPQWQKDGKGLIYTVENTTDIFHMSMKP